MAYTTVNKSTTHFKTLTYTGDGTSPRSLTGVGFQPDFLWIKNRTGASSYEHRLMDAVRGSNKVLHTSTNGAESSEEYYTVSSFDSDGWTGRNGTGSNQVITGGNDSGYDFVSWNWKANGAGSSNTDGSITSTVSVNTTSGFSIVSFAGNSTSGATVGHGLGVVPKVVIVKSRTTSTYNWAVYHSSIGATKYLRLNSNLAATTNVDRWNDTAPTSSVFTLGNAVEVNATSNNYIAYCFADVKGYCKIGSYTGDGSTDGPFIYTGFRPAFILTKTTGTDNWRILDEKRLGYNPSNSLLQPSINQNDSNQTWHDIYSNGFKLRTTDTGDNADGVQYIYMAIGQSLVSTNNIPVTAR